MLLSQKRANSWPKKQNIGKFSFISRRLDKHAEGFHFLLSYLFFRPKQLIYFVDKIKIGKRDLLIQKTASNSKNISKISGKGWTKNTTTKTIKTCSIQDLKNNFSFTLNHYIHIKCIYQEKEYLYFKPLLYYHP